MSVELTEVYMARPGSVTLGHIAMVGDREVVRAALLDTMTVHGYTHIWFQDEVGTSRDAISGPCPVYGPNACKQPSLN